MTELKKWEDLYAGFSKKNTRVAEYVKRKIDALKRPKKSAAFVRPNSPPQGSGRRKKTRKRTHKKRRRTKKYTRR